MRADLDVLGPPVGVGVPLGGEGGDGHARLGDEPAAVLVVEVDHAEPAALGREQPRLGLEVVLHAGVELHVLRAEVVEDGDVEDTAVDPAEHQRVAGNLHRDGVDAALAHDGEERLEIGGLGGGALGLDAFVADAHLDGADEPGVVSGAAQAALHEIRRGGLARGAGDSDLEQVGAGVAVDLGGQFTHAAPWVGGHQERQTGRGGAFGARRVGQDRRRAEVGGLGGEVGAVEAGAGQGRVHVPGANRSRVVRDAGRRPVRRGLGTQPGGQVHE